MKSKNQELQLFIILSSLFIAALVTCNLIANKFVSIDLGFKTFIVSAGILPYPVTFLITDILSEIYGQKKLGSLVAWVTIGSPKGFRSLGLSNLAVLNPFIFDLSILGCGDV